jgi:hypothetical protein
MALKPPQGELVKMAFKVFNNWDEAWDQRKAQLFMAALRPPPPTSRWAGQQHIPPGACFKCKTLPFTSPATRTLSTMWPEWTLEVWLPLFVSAVSHSHSQQSEGLTDLLGLAAEDWCGPGTLAPFKITSVTVQVAGRPQSPTWCYLTSWVRFILHRSLWWGWTVSTSQRKDSFI